MSMKKSAPWESPSAVCDGCGETIWSYSNEVVLTYVLNEYAQPVLDSPNHYHPWCLPARPADDE